MASSVYGSIAFPPSNWGEQRVEGLMMHFSKGKLTSFTCKKGRAGVEKVLAEAGDAARSFREFALGFNPALAIAATGNKWIPYYPNKRMFFAGFINQFPFAHTNCSIAFMFPINRCSLQTLISKNRH